MTAPFSAAGASPSSILRASPSTMAVLPTPASPTKSGLFLRRRASTCSARSICDCRPISGSISPARARSFRLTANCGQRIDRRLVGVVVAVVVAVPRHAGLGRQQLGDAVRDVADHVEAADPLLLQEGDRVRLRLGEERHQHVGAVGLGLPGPEHVVDRALDHARERQRRLRPLAILLGQRLDLLVEEVLQLADEARDRAAAVLDDVAGLLVHHQREQQVLEPGELVSAVGRVVERVPDRGLQLWAEHAHVSWLFLKDA